MNEAFMQAIQQTLLAPEIWGVVVLSAIYGVMLGAMPGLTATMGVALFIPMTFWMEPVPAIAAIVTMVACAIFAGDIPTALMRIPGTPASAAYANEAYSLTQRGEVGRALGTALWFSVTGGLFGAVVLMLAGHQLARVAAWFSVAEYFWLYLLGLSCAVVIGQGSVSRALFGLLLGLLFSTVGLSAVHADARFTFGRTELYQGINFIPAMIGLFGLSEVLRNMASLVQPVAVSEPSPVQRGGILGPALWQQVKRPCAWLRSSVLGAMAGILPGAGADIAAWVSVAASKRFRRGEKQTRSEEATSSIADACAANSASLAGAWIPALVFGIPGDSVTAIVIGVLYMKNLKPGPEIFDQQGALVYSIYLVFLLANLVLLPVGLLAVRAGGLVIRIPRPILLPIILLFCIIGAYAVNGSPFDIALMAGLGLLAVVCERWNISLGAMVLGIILGGPLEERFVQTLSGGQGNLAAFVDRPVAAILAVVCLVVWMSVPLRMWQDQHRTHPPN